MSLEPSLISRASIERLGAALVELHCKYPKGDIKKILDYAYAHRELSGRPEELADILGDFAAKLRNLAQSYEGGSS